MIECRKPDQVPIVSVGCSNPDIGDWVGEARRGSQQAFNRLHHRFAPLVHAILLGRFRPAIADELTQECFVVAFQRMEQLVDENKFGPWIATIARRLRPSESYRDSPHDFVYEIESVESRPDDKAEAEALLRAVSELPEAYRETLMLRLVEGLSGLEIAELTGLTAASVRVNLHRGMHKLREALGIDPPATKQGGT